MTWASIRWAKAASRCAATAWRGHRMGGMMLMRMADSNRDGAVTRDEFTAAAATRFDAADTNRDGTLTPAERQAARSAMHERMQRHDAAHAMPGSGRNSRPAAIEAGQRTAAR